MTEKSQVELFLNEFRRCWLPKCIVINRTVNNEALIELGFTPKQRRNIILSLTSKDFVKGPVPDESKSTEDVWFFGKKMDDTEIYIKLKIYYVEDKKHAKCLSFHKAKKPLKYPFK